MNNTLGNELNLHGSVSSWSKSIVTLKCIVNSKRSTCSSEDSRESEKIYIPSKGSLFTILPTEDSMSCKIAEDPLSPDKCSCIIT